LIVVTVTEPSVPWAR